MIPMNTTTLPYKLLTSFHYGVPPLPTHQVVYQTTHYLPTCSVPTYSYSIPRILSIILILFSSLSLPSSLLTALLLCSLLTLKLFFSSFPQIISPPLLFSTLPPTYFTPSTFYLLSTRFRTATGPHFHKRFLNASKTGNRLKEKEESLD
jgi:hypothetical protein